ncbi:B3 domain-containing protein Os12g0592300 [Euphorbia peplus]|nr:B3 domain-containing protein Os12g0592300 [Euphorbia peplus]
MLLCLISPIISCFHILGKSGKLIFMVIDIKGDQGEMLNARRPCFFDIFSKNLTAERLRIPARFSSKHLKVRTSGSVSLIGPSGNIWPVTFVQLDEDNFLDHGWPIFIKDHFIECGDLLVFRYDGELCFTVQIFDLSGCEKEAAFHSKCSQDSGQFYRSIDQKREREEHAESSDISCQCLPKKVRRDLSLLHSEDMEKKVDIEGVKTTKGDSMQEIQQCWSLCQYSAMSSESKTQDEKSDLKTAADTLKRLGKEDVKLPDTGYGPIFSEREKRVAQSFTSSLPYFVRIMKRFNISGSYTLNVPYKFSTVHLPSCKTEIILRTIKGTCWSVNSVPTTRVHTSHTFCGGWMAFVRDNQIKIGDVCIFELARNYELRVFILRVGNEVLENQCGKVERASVGCYSTSNKPKSFPKKSRKNALKVHSRLMIDVYDPKGLKESQAVAIPIDMRKHGRATEGSGSDMSRTVTENQACVRMIAALDEERAAKSFSSVFPNFVRSMKKFNISGSYTLKIPHKFSATHLPDCKTEIILRNSEGEHWSVNSVPDSKGRKLHTFCGGWMAFVRDNNVKMGDICIFELVSTYEMVVHISGVGSKAPNSP